MFEFYVDKNKITVRQREPVTSGSVNVYQVRFTFSQDWDGLTPTAVFKGGGETRSVLLGRSGECTIPWEVLQEPLGLLEAGVYGARDGSKALPTVWTSLGIILPGAAPGEAARPPAPDAYQQILAQSQEVREEVAQSAAAAAQAVRDADEAAKAAEQAVRTAREAQEACEAAASAAGAAQAAAGSAAVRAADSAEAAAGAEGRAQASAGSAQRSADSARREAERAAALTARMPVVRDGVWWTYDPEREEYASTGQAAQGLQGEPGPQGPKGDPGTEVVIRETYGPSAEVAVDMAVPGTPLQIVSQIVPRQEGEGTPSLENVRNMTGWDGVTLKRNSETFTRSFPEAVYAGSYDWTTGELTVTHRCFSLAVKDMNNSEAYPGWYNIMEMDECFERDNNSVPSSRFGNIGTGVSINVLSANRVIFMPVQTYGMTQSEWKARYPELTVQFVFPLLEQRTIRLPPAEFTALAGGDVLSSECGDTAVTFSADLKQYVDKQIRTLYSRSSQQ